MRVAEPIDRDAILALVPHQGAMCLWDEVRAWDAGTIQVIAHNHRNPAHPLRSDGRLRAIHLCEYGAQAMAVHGGLLARASGGSAKPGLLVALASGCMSRGSTSCPVRWSAAPKCSATVTPAGSTPSASNTPGRCWPKVALR